MKEICSRITALVLLTLCTLTVHAAAPWTGSGTTDAPYLVGTAQELKEIAAQVNAGNYADSAFKLTADINLDSTVHGEFTAIGTETILFRGVFDGDSHIISNLYINKSSSVPLIRVCSDIRIVRSSGTSGWFPFRCREGRMSAD